MPPIPIYSSSPINAAKAEGVTPKTASSEGIAGSSIVKEQASTTTAVSPTTTQRYPPARPGATPSLPVATNLVQSSGPPRPTPTSNQDIDPSPPLPQPGAVPVLPETSSSLPPPPKVGQAYHPPQQTTAPQANIPYPPQMSIPPPTVAYPTQRGSSTSTEPISGAGPRPTPLPGMAERSLDHPPGYQQDANASEFSSYQRAAHNASVQSGSRGGSDGSAEEGVWDTARKWALAAGGSLAAAEGEVWRRINKE